MTKFKTLLISCHQYQGCAKINWSQLIVKINCTNCTLIFKKSKSKVYNCWRRRVTNCEFYNRKYAINCIFNNCNIINMTETDRLSHKDICMHYFNDFKIETWSENGRNGAPDTVVS